MGVLYFASLRQAVTTSLVKDVTYRLQWAPCCVTFLVNFGDASLPVLEVVCCVLPVQPHNSMCCAAAARLAADLHTHPMVSATAALLRGSHTPSCLLSRGGVHIHQVAACRYCMSVQQQQRGSGPSLGTMGGAGGRVFKQWCKGVGGRNKGVLPVGGRDGGVGVT